MRPDLSPACSSCPISQRVGGCCAVIPSAPAILTCDYMIVGEAPGNEEVEKGLVFVGASGKYLRSALKKAGINEEVCMFSNSTLCPSRAQPGSAILTPTEEEASRCVQHTLDMIAMWRPKVIIAVGGVAIKALTRKKISVTSSQGKWVKLGVTLDNRWSSFTEYMRVTHPDRPLPTPPTVLGDSPDALESIETFKELTIADAVSSGLYSEAWIDIPIMPVYHPSFILRSGREGQPGEDFLYALREAKNFVDTGDRQMLVGLEEKKFRWINDIKSLEEYTEDLLRRLRDGEFDEAVCDIETSEEKNEAESIGLLRYDPRVRILTVQFCYRPGEAVAIMANHRESAFNDPVSFGILRHNIEKILTTVPTVYQNGVFDVIALRCKWGIKGIKVNGDTMLEDHWLNAGKGLASDLDRLGARYSNSGKHKSRAKLWRGENPGKTFEDMPLDIALEYSAGDAETTLVAHQAIKRKLEEEGRWDAFYDFYFRVHHSWQVICDLEWAGMKIDKEALDAMDQVYPEKLAQHHGALNRNPFIVSWLDEDRIKWNTEAQAYNASIPPKSRKRPRKIFSVEDWHSDPNNKFNPGSAVQIYDLLFNYLKVPTDIPNMEYSDECPVCNSEYCRCHPRYRPVKPRTNDHNREVISKSFTRWKDGYAKADNQRGVEWAECVLHIIDNINEYRTFDKLHGSYIKGIYPLIIDKPPPDGPWDPRERCPSLYKPYCDFPEPWSIHPNYHMDGTETGRISSSKPNGQNYPAFYVEDKYNVKRPYISRWKDQGGIIVQPDLSQIEIRLMASVCREERLIKVLEEGGDVHTFVASAVHNIPEDKVTGDIRTPIKRVSFGIIYGQSPGSLAQQLNIEKSESEHLFERVFALFPNIKGFIDKQHSFVKKRGYVETLMGRRRYLEHVRSAKEGDHGKAYRDAVNTPVQGTASDLCWTSFGRAWRDIQDFHIPALPFSLIHDAQGFDVGPGYFMDVMEIQYYQMVYRPQELWDWVRVRPEIEFSLGVSWGRMVKVKLLWGKDLASTPFKGKSDEFDHNRIVLSGKRQDLDDLVTEIRKGGQEVDIKSDIPHPKKDEADLGNWCMDICVERPNPVCKLDGRKLVRLR